MNTHPEIVIEETEDDWIHEAICHAEPMTTKEVDEEEVWVQTD